MTVPAMFTLRGFLVLLFLCTLCAQIWYIPQAAIAGAQAFPELSAVAAPYAIVLIAIVACVQLVLVALWALVGLVRRGTLATEQAAGWVNAMMWAGGVATALAIGLEVHVLGVLGVSPPAVGVLLSLCIIAGAAFTVLLVVLRRRGFRDATAA